MVSKHVLFLDSGNSRFKYFFDNGYGYFANLGELSSFLRKKQVGSIVVSSVSGNLSELHEMARTSKVPIQEVVVEDDFFNLKLCYPDISKLGVDRWVAMLSAKILMPTSDVWVVDCGTALTIDLVSRRGLHVGGVIAPGLKISAEALSCQTAELPLSTYEVNGELGQDTIGCINYGVVNSAVALIESTVKKFDDFETNVLITGGDCEVIARQLSFEANIDKHLVLDGLRRYWQIKAGNKGGVE